MNDSDCAWNDSTNQQINSQAFVAMISRYNPGLVLKEVHHD